MSAEETYQGPAPLTPELAKYFEARDQAASNARAKDFLAVFFRVVPIPIVLASTLYLLTVDVAGAQGPFGAPTPGPITPAQTGAELCQKWRDLGMSEQFLKTACQAASDDEFISKQGSDWLNSNLGAVSGQKPMTKAAPTAPPGSDPLVSNFANWVKMFSDGWSALVGQSGQNATPTPSP